MVGVVFCIIFFGIIFFSALGSASGNNNDTVQDEWDYVENGYKWGKKDK